VSQSGTLVQRDYRARFGHKKSPLSGAWIIPGGNWGPQPSATTRRLPAVFGAVSPMLIAVLEALWVMVNVPV
jgi:hypothetical protein